MFRAALLALTFSLSLCSGCATPAPVVYPSYLWPELRHGADCAVLSGSYEGMTEDFYPTPSMRGMKGQFRRSVAETLSDVSPPFRPENLSTIRRVEIDVPNRRAKLFGAWEDAIDLSGWSCSGDGALVASVERMAVGELRISSPVTIHFELRQAADNSLIVKTIVQFSDTWFDSSPHESWERYRPAAAPGP